MTTKYDQMTLANTELLLKAIITEFCKQNFTFRSKLKVVGSIHVVVDDEKVLSCLLNENREAPRTQQKPQQQQETIMNEKAKAKVEMSVSKLNKRKRFVPKAHQSPQPSEENANDTTVVAVENLCLQDDADDDDENDYNKVEDSNNKAQTKSKESEINGKTDQIDSSSNKDSSINGFQNDVENEGEELFEQDDDDEEGLVGEDISSDDNKTIFSFMNAAPFANATNKQMKMSKSSKITNKMGNSTDQQGEFECEQCGKKFKYHCYYKRHVDALHSNEPKYVCELCKKSYKWEASFRHHLRLHFTRETSHLATIIGDNNKENSLFNQQRELIN